LLSAEQDALIPMALWLSSEPQLIEHRASALLLLDAGDDVMALKNRLDDVPAIAIRFSDFNDGRGYSTAVLLRERLGFTGALRAVGDVLRDQLFYLLRCGFDQFVPRADKSTEDFLGGYRDFSQVYQRSATSLPLYRRARSIQKAAP
jgi:uncharacterized protein (DUF934 family)